MGLRNVITNATKAAFAATGDIPVSCSIERTTGTYDPATDTYTDSSTTTYTFSGLMSGYRQGLVDGTVIQQGDMRVVAEQRELTVEPENGETVTVDGEDWQVVNHGADGVSVTWWLQLRK